MFASPYNRVSENRLVTGAYTGTWAGRPAASSVPVGTEINITDIFSRYRTFISDGTYWVPHGGNTTLVNWAVPVILAGTGTVAANGTLTVTGVFNTIYAGGAWVYLPAGAVPARAAGLHWTVFSSTSVGQVYDVFVDAAAAFTPYVPTVALVAAVGSGVAYASPINTNVYLSNGTVPGGLLSPYGALRTTTHWSFTNSASGKSPNLSLGGQSLQLSGPHTTIAAYSFITEAQNRGVLTRQSNTRYNLSLGGSAGTVNANQWLTINTAIDMQLINIAQRALALDHMVLESFTLELLG
jgi:hypothetical protein